ncbi:MAG: hypothetical protein HY291_18600 [Planctomycetes bacterium]|nr:hypothetical protein [Planctomycetota bacterium]
MPATQLWGDCHTHSHYSDGLMGIAEQTPYYRSFGDDFRFQTDHFIIAVPDGKPATKWLHASDWERYAADCRAATTREHLCIPAVELGWQAPAELKKKEGWFDTKLYPPAGQDVPGESFYAAKSYVDAVRAAKAAGFRMVIAHIDQGAPLERFSGAEIDGLEVRSDIEELRPFFTRATLKHWDRMLTTGHRVSLSSGSDGHQPDLWAGSAFRTVVLDTPFEAAAITDAVIAGRSYLSSTWHPDSFAALGWPARPNPVDGGASMSHMVPWWEFKQIPLLQGRDPRAVVEESYRKAMEIGRVRREDYPVLEDFRVAGAICGGCVKAGAKVPIRAAWKTHVPPRFVRLVADGQSLLEMPTSHPAFGKLEGVWETEADLRGKRYVRLELEAAGEASQVEVLAGNPVYVEA